MDFDPIKIGYDPSGDFGLFIKAFIVAKGAIAYTLPETYCDVIVAQKQEIVGLDSIMEYLDTRFALNRLLPLDPLERAVTKGLIYKLLCNECPRPERDFILGDKCSVLDIAYAIGNNDIQHYNKVHEYYKQNRYTTSS
jgi:glutathione S-transferase